MQRPLYGSRVALPLRCNAANALPPRPCHLTASSSVAAGDAIQEKAITLNAPHSMSAARLGGDTLALHSME